MSEVSVEFLKHRLAAAPFDDASSWEDLLKDVAVACGGWGAHLVGSRADRSICLSMSGGISADVVAEFEARGGIELGANPRADAIIDAPLGSVMSEQDFLTADEIRRAPFYQDYYFAVDAPYALMTSDPGCRDYKRMAILLRGESQGIPSDNERSILQHLAPHLWSAMSLRSQIDDAGLKGALWAYEDGALSVVLLDRNLRVSGLSTAAERMIRGCGALGQRSGRFRLSCDRAQASLEAAVAQACATRTLHSPPERTIEFRHKHDVWQLAVRRLPREISSGVSPPTALVVVSKLEAPRRHWPLTPAEEVVLELVLRGESTREIAARRLVSSETVKSQLASIYAKFGVPGRIALIALHSAPSARR